VSSWRRVRRCALLPLALLSWAGAARAVDDDRVSVRQATLALDDRFMLRMTVGYRDVVDSDTAAKLQGGLPTTIVMRAYVFRAAGRAPLAATYKSCRVTFDLWDEVYRIDLSQSGEPDTAVASPTLDGVLRRCAEADRLAVVARAALAASTTYYVACVVEVNPVSPDMLDRIKRWVSRPSGTGATAPGDALFGSFVGLFVARIGTADRQISFRTQPFSL
jgi:hypothetical protein